MAKKAKEQTRTTDEDADQKLAAAVRESAQQIWLAGLGAYAKAQEEGQKMFKALVREGVTLQHRTREAASGKLEEVGDQLSQVAGDFGKQVNESWDRLESVFEERVSRALKRLGVPHQGEVDALHQRIAELNARLAARGGRQANRTAAKSSIHAAAADASAGADAPVRPATRSPAAKRARKAPAAKRAAKAAKPADAAS